jgi:hypothetical protein
MPDTKIKSYPRYQFTKDNADIYTLIPKLETYQSEIETLVRAALEGQPGSNPISVFFPGIEVKILSA